MRRAGWVLLAGLATAAMTTGCGGGDETGAGGGGGEGGGGEGGSTSTAPPTTTTGTTNPSATATTGTTNPNTTSTASGTTGECDDLVADSECGQCAGSKCCDELLACTEDADCSACLQGDEAACESPVVAALDSCLTGSCATECGTGPGVAPACDAPAASPSGGSCVTVDTSTAKPAGCTADYELSGAGTACEECIETAGDGGCCAEIEACKADANCDKCVTEGDAAACMAAETQLNALDACAGSKCQAACSTPVRKCNPVNNDGCTAGENCQITNSGSTACFEIPGSAGVCETCTEANYCAPGSICTDPSSGSGQCIKYCCDDGDCGTGTCDKEILQLPDVGICLAK